MCCRRKTIVCSNGVELVTDVRDCKARGGYELDCLLIIFFVES
jgi:hypothetical protein